MLQPHTSHLFQPWGFHVVGGIGNPVLLRGQGTSVPTTRSTVQMRLLLLLLLLCGQARPAPGSIVIRPGSKWQCGRLAVCQTTLPQARSLSQCPSVPLAPTHPPETNMKAHGDKVWQMLESRKAGQHTFLRRGPFMTLSTPVVSRY